MSTPSTNVCFQIVNNTQQNGGGFASTDIYLFMTSQGDNGPVAWTISTTDGTATIGPPPAPFTLQDLENAGGSIQVDPGTDAAGGRIYFATSSDIASSVSGPSPGMVDYYYDYVEFALTGPSTTSMSTPHRSTSSAFPSRSTCRRRIQTFRPAPASCPRSIARP